MQGIDIRVINCKSKNNVSLSGCLHVVEYILMCLNLEYFFKAWSNYKVFRISKYKLFLSFNSAAVTFNNQIY